MTIRKIPVPKTPRSAYNPGRPVSGLLSAQVKMLELAVLSHDAASSLRKAHPRTEGEAARYVQTLHETLRGHLKKSEAERAQRSPDHARSVRTSRSTSTRDGAKQYPATAGPSVAARSAVPAKKPAAVNAAVKTRAKKAVRKPR